MASNTENLDLLMKNPSTDGADTFNVQTMLNDNWQKIDNNAGTVAQTLANILKPTTPPIIGLPSSTTPDGMFQALGNTGELHVWRKTVIYNQPVPEVPGSYTLGAARQYTAGRRNTSTSASSYISNLSVSNEISVDLDGNVTLVNPTTVSLRVTRPASFESDSARTALGGYCYFMATDDTIGEACDMYLPRGQILYVAENAVYTYAIKEYDSTSSFDAAQLVTGVPGTPAIPAGTTTTYPVSTNPNAYQEGDDAKAAGYTLGEVVSGNFQVGYLSNVSEVDWNYSDTLNVADDGTLTLKNPAPAKINTATSSGYQNPSVLLGHFAVVTGHKENIPGSPFADEQIVYIPSNAVVSGMYIDRYQPVTGYAAIPAGTTIEYLGKLGDKARVQVVSYVGTGTYGKNNPCSLTFDFAPKVVRLLGGISSGGNFTVCVIYPTNTNYGIHSAILFTKALTTTYKARLGFSENNYTASYCKISQDGKTVTWYNNGDDQINTAGYTYYFLALG